MIWLRWTLFSVLLLLGGCVALCNWGIAAQAGRSRKGGSLVPLVGGVLVTAACLVAPAGPVRSLWWVPLVGDLGCVPMLALTAGSLLWVAISRQRQ
jgi:hypothetical protein